MRLATPLVAALLWLGIPSPSQAQEPDATALLDRARADLLRSEGCVIVDVAIAQVQQIGVRRTQSRGVIRARLDGGTWYPLGVRLEAGSAPGPDLGDGQPLVMPILGQHTGRDGQPAPLALSTQILGILDHDVEMGEAGRDAQGRLTLRHTWRSRDGLLSPPRANTLIATFDDTGRTRSWVVDVPLRERNEHGLLRQMTLELEVDAQGVPTREELDLRAGSRFHLQRTAQVQRVMDCTQLDAMIAP